MHAQYSSIKHLLASQMSQPSALAAPIPQAPIQTLTDDALLHMFTKFYELVKTQDHWRFGTSRGTAMFRLAHTCRRWRELIHGCPAFWSFIDLDLTKNRDLGPRVTFWLDRAGASPLIVKVIIYYGEEGGHHEPQMIRLAGILRGCLDRWASFAINALPHDISTFLQYCVGAVPILEALSFDTICDRVMYLGDMATASIDIPFCIASQSRVKVRLVSTNTPRLTSSFGSTIVDLTLHLAMELPIDKILDVLRSCPNLIKLNSAFTFTTPRSIIYDPTAPISLPRLAHLHLSSSNGLETLLSSMQSPALESLYLHDQYKPDGVNMMQALSMHVFQTCPSLSSITLSGRVDSRSSSNYATSPASDILPLHLRLISELRICGDSVCFPLYRLRFPGVESIHIELVHFNVVAHFLSSSHRVESIDLSDIWEIPRADTQYLLPALASLKIKMCLDFLDHIHAPQLSFVDLSGAGSKTPNLAPLFSPVDRSAPPLRTLHLHFIEIDNDNFIRCLERLPLLQFLKLANCDVSDNILHALGPPSSPQGSLLLPQLTKI
ncbi:hypothetical protein BOTBODRAFT_462915 [Botryobasidium botryosum FD-172 SS1]|uniref:F-box domain-containing protein n=1 Tax=Botryobasidium botryosum (strain FD-172 SS1) TaxID=930990 RepID=A0A067M6P2_BOTB1|nr:hypothetical protein BOTBODRAFT_462915 [Botryobasidium botryosum FD-172 SS1]